MRRCAIARRAAEAVGLQILTSGNGLAAAGSSSFVILSVAVMAALTPLSPEDLLPSKGSASKTEELEEDTEEDEDEVSGSLQRRAPYGALA